MTNSPLSDPEGGASPHGRTHPTAFRPIPSKTGPSAHPRSLRARLAAKIGALSIEVGQAGDPELAVRLARVATNLRGCVRGHRCEALACGCCQVRKAKRNRRRVERELEARGIGPGDLQLVTVTCPSRDPGAGLRTLSTLLERLKRLTVWKVTVVGGVISFEVDPPGRGSGWWLVHAHMLLEKRSGAAFPYAIKWAWEALLEKEGHFGGLHSKPVGEVWSERGGSAVAFYCTKRRRTGWLSLSGDQLLSLLKALHAFPLIRFQGSWQRAGRRESLRERTQRTPSVSRMASHGPQEGNGG